MSGRKTICEVNRSATAIDDPRVATAMQQYLEALEAGRCPSRKEFLDGHPEIAAELGGCLDGLEFVHEAARAVHQVEPAEESPACHTSTEALGDELTQPLGDYRIVREIGRGGMGVVYEAMQLSLGRRVALKILPLAAALDPKHLQRFKNEAQAAAQLHHTNLVPVYAVGSERGVHYYAMQLIDGYSLADLIEQRRQFLGKSVSVPADQAAIPPTEKAIPFKPPIPEPPKLDDPTLGFVAAPPVASAETFARRSTVKTSSEQNVATYFRTAAGLIQQAAQALEHAHQLGVVHRDIKPANLLLDDRGTVWVTDFGLAHFQANMQLTRTGDMLGTLRYMSPEQASGDRVVLDHRTDIYSLGVTLYELLTLEPVIEADEPHSVLRQIVEDDPPSPRKHDKHIPRELETIVLKAIAKAPGERYATSAEVADDLQRWLDDEPIKARRPTLVEHAARWSRRHWALLAAAACVLGVAAVGLLLSTIVIAREHTNTLAAYKAESQQREAAVKQRAVADQQRQAAEKQRQLADESFRQARHAVDTFLGLSEEELAGKPTLHQVRRRFLEAALEYYNNFLEQRRDDPAVAEELLTTSQWVKQIVEELTALERLASFMLLTHRDVQEDIGLSEAQREGLGDVATLGEKALRAGDRGVESLGLRATGQVSEQVKELARVIEAVLMPHQIKRLQQVALQQRGPLAFKNPEVVKALALTADQRKIIHAIIEEESPERRSGPGGPGGPRGHGHGTPPPWNDFEQPPPPEFGPGPPPHPEDRGPGVKKGGPGGFGGPDGFNGPRDKGGKGGPPPGEFGGPGGFGGPGRRGPPPDRGFGNEQGPGGRGGPPRPGDRGGKGPGEPGSHGGGPPPPSQHEMRLAADRTIGRIEAILTPVQQAAWKTLVGPPFTHNLAWRFE